MNCMWLELSLFCEKFTEGKARKLAVNFTDLVTLTSQKTMKTRGIQALRAILMPSLRAALKF